MDRITLLESYPPVRGENMREGFFSSMPDWMIEAMRADIVSLDVEETTKANSVRCRVGLYQDGDRHLIGPGHVIARMNNGTIFSP